MSLDTSGMTFVQQSVLAWERSFPSAVFAGTPTPRTLDIALSTSDLIVCTRRWMVVWANLEDPRGKFFQSFSGWNGIGHNALRWSFFTRSVEQTTNDNQYHQTIQWRREWAGSVLARDTAMGIVEGESLRCWKGRL